MASPGKKTLNKMEILEFYNLEEEVPGCKTGSKYRSDLNNIEFQALSVSN